MRIQNNCKNVIHIYLIIEDQHLELSKLLGKIKDKPTKSIKTLDRTRKVIKIDFFFRSLSNKYRIFLAVEKYIFLLKNCLILAIFN